MLGVILKSKRKKKIVYNTWCSQAVTHLSTNHARRCLTSVIGREPVFSTWYGRRHQHTQTKGICAYRCLQMLVKCCFFTRSIRKYTIKINIQQTKTVEIKKIYLMLYQKYACGHNCRHHHVPRRNKHRWSLVSSCPALPNKRWRSLLSTSYIHLPTGIFTDATGCVHLINCSPVSLRRIRPLPAYRCAGGKIRPLIGLCPVCNHLWRNKTGCN
jgi:hypothetical protein